MKRSSGVPAFGAGWKKQPSKRQKKIPFVKTSLARQNAILNKQEVKVFDTALSFNIDTTGEVPATGQLCLVTVGDTLNNRDGAVIEVKSLQIRAQFTFTPAAAATASGVTYLYVMLDKQCNGAAAAVTDVMTSTTFADAMPNVPNQYRFKTIRRIPLVFTAPAGVTTAYNNVHAWIDEYIVFKKPIQIRYTASAGAITDVASNNLFLMAGASGAIDDLVTVTGTSRLRFTG